MVTMQDAISIIKEFVGDVKHAGPEHVSEEWPELIVTFERAKIFLHDAGVPSDRAEATVSEPAYISECVAAGYVVHISDFGGYYWEHPEQGGAGDDFNTEDEAWVDCYRANLGG